MAKRILVIGLFALVTLRAGMVLVPRFVYSLHRAPPAALPYGMPVPDTVSTKWGGGRLAMVDQTPAAATESLRRVLGGDSAGVRSYARGDFGVALAQRSDSDYHFALAMPAPGKTHRTMILDMARASQFRRQLLPDSSVVDTPCPDVPLYPGAECRMQVGRSSPSFIGFYLTRDSIEAVRTYYIRELGRRGWRRMVPKQPGALEVFAKEKESRSVLVNLRRQDDSLTRIGLTVTSPAQTSELSRR
jgi:hypothetical protein